MRKSALMALGVALLIPLLSYWLMKYYGKDAAHLPNRYFYDSVIVRENGKNDTIWHKVKDMHFTNQMGKEVKLSDAEGKVIVMNFVFTRCPVVCPGLTRSMKKLQDSYVKNPGIVQFISVSVDPEHDSVPNLRKFADRFNVNHDNWWFVTGNKTEVYDFAIQEIKANIADPGIDTAFIHTEDFFLLDRDRVI
ncbi:MAG: SCO family protein, partial [Chitinophagaceae bacterium]